MNLLSRAKQELIGGVPHAAEIQTYCKGRISQIQAVTPVLKLYQPPAGFGLVSNPVVKAERQVQAFMNILAQFSNSESDETRTKNIEYLSEAHDLRPFNRDIKAILKGEKPELPESLAEIVAFLAREEAAQEVKREQRRWEQIQRDAELEKQRIAAEQARKREALERELGVKLA